MKNRSVHIIVFFVLLMTIFSLSCDLLLVTDAKLPKHEPKITFVLHYPHGGWKDEVIVDVEGIIHLRRLEGDHLPEASRRLDEQEFRYIRNLFEEFYSLDDEYIHYDESTTTLYTITYYGNEEEKTVRCDNRVYDHTLWGDPGFTMMKVQRHCIQLPTTVMRRRKPFDAIIVYMITHYGVIRDTGF